jgi:hypothetical protein
MKNELQMILLKVKKLKLYDNIKHCEDDIASWQKNGYYCAIQDVQILLMDEIDKLL